jgi:hypothetical protein
MQNFDTMYQSTQRQILEENNLHIRCCETLIFRNLRSLITNTVGLVSITAYEGVRPYTIIHTLRRSVCLHVVHWLYALLMSCYLLFFLDQSVYVPPSLKPPSTNIFSLWLYSPCGPWPLFQFLNPTNSRYDYLDGGSARRKVATYTQNNTNTE